MGFEDSLSQPAPPPATTQPLRQVEPSQDVPFVELATLSRLNMLPRFGSPKCQVRPRRSFEASRTLFVFVSHRWLSPSEDQQRSHPDLPFNGSPKFKLLMELCSRIKKALPADFQIAIWMDWMCLDQTNDTAKELGDELQRIIAASDVLVSVVYDQDHRKWSYPVPVTDWYADYKAQGWTGSTEAYWQRAWCRLEAALSAVTPLPVGDQAWDRKRDALSGLAFGRMMKCGRRPHILFGTKEMADKLPLIVLPPMLEPHLKRFAPRLATRNITLKDDAALIMEYSGRALDAPPVIQISRIDLGRGRIQDTDCDGAVYTGDWKNGTRNGDGEMVYADGNTYVGNWKDGEMHGKGKYLYANGDIFEGDFDSGKMQGSGTYRWWDGYIYTGQWADDKMHGEGTLALNNGFSVVTLYSGQWSNGNST